MRRYERGKSRDRDDLQARLNALQPPRSKRRRKRRSNLGPAILGILLVVGILGIIYLIYSSAVGGADQSSAKSDKVDVKVVKGDTVSSVADKLDAAGVVSNATIFKLEARLSGNSTEIKPGQYTFSRGENSSEILKKLTAGKQVATFTITIPEGLTLKQTAETVAKESNVSEKDFEAAAKKTDYSYSFLKDPAIKTTEGYLFPKQYEFEKGTNAHQIVDRLLNQYLIETQDVDFSGAKKRLNLSENELLTVASLIEREAASPKEKPIIASVIYNRMRQGTPLQIDASIQYALGKPKAELSLQDLKIDSPYNTYEHPGLPPGPICSPSKESIEAAVKPANTDYLYYVLKANGKEHYFTNNYNDFLRAKAEAGR